MNTSLWTCLACWNSLLTRRAPIRFPILDSHRAPLWDLARWRCTRSSPPRSTLWLRLRRLPLSGDCIIVLVVVFVLIMWFLHTLLDTCTPRTGITPSLTQSRARDRSSCFSCLAGDYFFPFLLSLWKQWLIFTAVNLSSRQLCFGAAYWVCIDLRICACLEVLVTPFRFLDRKQLVRVMDAGNKFLFGWCSHKADTEEKALLYSHLYSYASVKAVVHWFQIIRTKVNFMLFIFFD